MPDRRSADIAVLLPAAGRSSRMAGGAKLERTIRGVSMLRRAAGRARRAGLAPLVVVGASERVSGLLVGISHRLVINQAPELGLGHTLRLGVAALPDDVAGVLVMLPDMPHVSTAMLRRLIAVFRQESRPIVTAWYETVTAPPAIFARSLFAELASGHGDSHGRRVIDSAPERVQRVHFPRWRGMDVDTRDDLLRAREVASRRGGAGLTTRGYIPGVPTRPESVGCGSSSEARCSSCCRCSCSSASCSRMPPVPSPRRSPRS